MSVDTLRTAIAERAQQLLGPALLTVGVTHHKKDWRDCCCSWCQTKREATVVIGSHAPCFIRDSFVEDLRDAWREDKRRLYRQKLKHLENI